MIRETTDIGAAPPREGVSGRPGSCVIDGGRDASGASACGYAGTQQQEDVAEHGPRASVRFTCLSPTPRKARPGLLTTDARPVLARASSALKEA